MKVKYLKDGEWIIRDTPEDHPYKEIGQCLLDADVLPDNNAFYMLTAESDRYGVAQYKVQTRGYFFNKEGVKSPSMHVTEVYDFAMPPIVYENLSHKYLVCVSASKDAGRMGNNKFYLLEDPTSEGFYAQYGRVGVGANDNFGRRRTKKPYQLHHFWILYYEKLSKGYVDMTEAYDAPDTKSEKSGLYGQLLKYSKCRIDEDLGVQKVTKKMVQEAKKCLYEMKRRKTVEGFNRQLLKLFHACPRKIYKVHELLAKAPEEFEDIIEREESLIKAMEGSTVTEREWGNIKVWPARDDQRDIVMSHLGDSLKGKIKNIYRVINPETEERYRKANKGVKKKLFWHGSRNENWLSIIKNGLSLNPDAHITGKMLGNGIYFAPSPSKSFGYTSAHGTRWAHGNSNTAFMALFETAYGKPYHPHDTRQFTASELHAKGYNCVHARSKDTWLKSDEICFYNESDVTIAYLVEFAS